MGGLRNDSLSEISADTRKQVAREIMESIDPAPLPQALPEESPCTEECICWWECNGVAINEECPWRKHECNSVKG